MSSIASAIITAFTHVITLMKGRRDEIEAIDFPKAIDALFDDAFFDEEVGPTS
jgi:hypothetical protein